MIKVCVCDDDELIANRISSIIDRMAEERNINIVKDVYYNGTSLVKIMERENEYYDLIFLDIEMEDIDGIEVAKRLRLKDELANIIYVTSYENYAVETFTVRPYQFVLKPFEDEVIEKHFMDVYERVISNDECFEFRYKSAFYKVMLKDIMYFESKNRSVFIYMSNGTDYEFYDKLDRVEKKISNSKLDFLRIHKSMLVNSKFIVKKRYDEVELANGERLAISQVKRKILNEHYMKKVEGEMKHGISN